MPPREPFVPAQRVITQVYKRRPRQPASFEEMKPLAPPEEPQRPAGADAVPPLSNQHAMYTRAKIGFRVPTLYHVEPLSAIPKTYGWGHG